MDYRWFDPSVLNFRVMLFSSYVLMVLGLSQCDFNPPRIILNPVSQTANPGSRVEFLVQAKGGRSYTWIKDDQPLADQIETALVLENIVSTDAGNYACIVSNEAGSTQSDLAELIVNNPPEILENFQPQTVIVGQELVLFGQVAGTLPLAYRIFHNNKLVGETSECFWRISQTDFSDAGSWFFSVSNITGIPIHSLPVEIIISPIVVEGEAEGEIIIEGEPEGQEGEIIIEGEGQSDGEIIIEGETEAEILPDGEQEGELDGESDGEGENPSEGEGQNEGQNEGQPEGEGEPLPLLCQNNFCLTANLGDNLWPPLLMTFCEAFTLFYNSVPRGLLGNFVSFIDYFTPQGDLNGQSWVDKRQGDRLIIYQIGGNGIPDCSFELKLLEAVLTDPGLCVCYSGLNHKAVHEAWDANMIKLAEDFGVYWELAEVLLSGFRQIICAYVTIGDGGIDYSVENYASANGSLGLVLGVAYLFGDKIPNSQPDPDSYLKFPEWFGPWGDADGDGWANIEEYSACNGDVEVYVSAALDPEIVP